MKRLAALAPLLLASLLLAGCPAHRPVANAGAATAAAERPQPTRDVYVLLLILDGGRADTVYKAVDDGWMPNFKKYVFDRGVRVKDAIAIFPSVTTSGHQALITGLLPGHSGITGLDWFDRASGRVTDYLSFDVLGIEDDLFNKDNPVHVDELFDEPDNLIADLGNDPAATVYEPFHMGTTDYAPKFPMLSSMYHFVMNQNQALTKGAADDLKAIYERPHDEIPRFVMGTFLGHDVCEHHFGAGSPQHVAEMKLEDRELGEIVDRMKKAGIWEKTYIVLAADHGQHPTGKYVSIPKILRNAGLRPRGYYAANVNTYSSLIAITSANIYLNKGGDWRDSISLADLRSFPTPDGKRVDLIDTLLAKDAVEFALVPEPPDRVHVMAGGGRHGVVTRRSFRGVDYFSYATIGGAGDPLGYDAVPAASAWVNDGRFHAADAWALATRDSQYPDAPLQLTQLFDGDRAGDLVVTAKPGWHFKPRDYVSSHGGLDRDDMRVPLVLSGPDIKPGEIPFARTADVYPTLKRIFGLPVSTARMDGRPLDEILPWVKDDQKVEARHAANVEAEAYFTDLAALEGFLDREDGAGAPARDPAALFADLKSSDLDAFGKRLQEETQRDASLRREVASMRDSLGEQVRSLDRTVQIEGRDGYNDDVWTERRDLKRDKERSYILGRTLERLDARLARAGRLAQVLDLVRISHDVDELERLYAQAASSGAGNPN